MSDRELPARAISEAADAAGLGPLKPEEAEKLSSLFDLLQRWNSRLNLTAIRSPEEILRRHFLESIYCARRVPDGSLTLLDYGSGAGFPGLPIAVCCPELAVTLAESQGKKASFLREAVRVLGLQAEVFPQRVEEMDVARVFDVVTMRAVDKMDKAIAQATGRVCINGCLMVLGKPAHIALPEEFEMVSSPVSSGEQTQLLVCRRK